MAVTYCRSQPIMVTLLLHQNIVNYGQIVVILADSRYIVK